MPADEVEAEEPERTSLFALEITADMTIWPHPRERYDFSATPEECWPNTPTGSVLVGRATTTDEGRHVRVIGTSEIGREVILRLSVSAVVLASRDPISPTPERRPRT